MDVDGDDEGEFVGAPEAEEAKERKNGEKADLKEPTEQKVRSRRAGANTLVVRDQQRGRVYVY
jgi:hypothetical protein